MSGRWNSIERRLELLDIAVEQARAEHSVGKRSAESLATLEARARRDRQSIIALLRGRYRGKGN